MSEDEVLAFRMLVSECNKICGIEIVCGPFALDGCRSLSVCCNDKVYLVPALVAPIEHFPALRARHHFIQYEMLPQQPKVIITQVLPASVVTNETGIEAIDFRRGDYLSGPTSAEGANDMRDERCLKNAEVVCDGWPAYFARAGKSSCVKDAAALRHDKLGRRLYEHTSASGESVGTIMIRQGQSNVEPYSHRK